MNLGQLFMVSAASASLYFSPLPSSIPVGQDFTVEINLGSGGLPTLGTDAVILYNPQVLEARKIISGNIYPSYPESGKQINNTQGKVSFSGTSTLGSPVTADGLLGKVVFRAKKTGKTTLSFLWQPDDTRDSNIVPYQGSADLLVEKPADLNLTFKPSSWWTKILNFLRQIISF